MICFPKRLAHDIACCNSLVLLWGICCSRSLSPGVWIVFLGAFLHLALLAVQTFSTFIFPSRIPNFQERLCLCFKVEVFVWHQIDCFCVMSPPPHMQRMQERRRMCCCFYDGLLRVGSNLSSCTVVVNDPQSCWPDVIPDGPQFCSHLCQVCHRQIDGRIKWINI
jgi:hypothetical protein